MNKLYVEDVGNNENVAFKVAENLENYTDVKVISLVDNVYVFIVDGENKRTFKVDSKKTKNAPKNKVFNGVVGLLIGVEEPEKNVEDD